MKKNMGLIDRVVRSVIAVAVIALYLTGQITGVAAIILGILSVVFLLTSAIAFCPLYVPLGISTAKKGQIRDPLHGTSRYSRG